MHPDAIALFRELADRSSAEREAYYARHQVPTAVRTEVESLLRFDRETADSLQGYVAAAADRVVFANPLTPGARLGPYEILAPVGAGGMGEVYKARDTRLDRTVAIKVLPPDVAGDADLNERFAREARMLAALSHPHICPVFDVGHQDATAFLVMEYLDGETLAERLTRGQLPLDQTLRYAIQIADALDQAHSAVIVHRDLKPGNIMLTSSGAKLLDFGLAKPARPALGTALAQLPTTPPMTARGTILGTFQYMAPEQLEGGEADARSDIFAFGAVLYEMLTGRTAFEGRSPISVMAAILQSEPPSIAERQPLAPPLLAHLIESCLAKDPKDRWQSVADARRALTWIAGEATEAVGATQRAGRARVAWITAAIGFLAAAAAFAAYLSLTPPDVAPIRFPVSPPANTELSSSAGTFAVSPDGRSLAFVTSDPSGKGSLWLRSLDAVAARPLPGTDGARGLFWSPDGRFIAFYAAGKLKTVNIADGSVQRLCDVPDTPFGRGGTWSRKGVIVFQLDAFGPLYRVSASGGTPIPVTTLDEARKEIIHAWPSFLPDGTHFLYSVRDSTQRGRGVLVGSLDSKEGGQLIDAQSNAMYTSGHLLFGINGALMGQRFDVRELQLEGEPFSINENVFFNPNNWHTSFSVSGNGVLAYRDAGALTHRAVVASQLGWVDRAGKPLASIGERGEYVNISLSNDGTRIAVDRRDPQTSNRDLWVIDVSRGTMSRLTTHPDPDSYPVWSPDDDRIVFASSRNDPGKEFDTLYVKASNGSSDEQAILERDKVSLHLHPLNWSADGRYVIFERYEATKSQDLWILPLTGTRIPFPFVQTEFKEVGAHFSPDGQFVTYASDETGRFEVYVRSFTGSAGKWQISINGGGHPVWSRNGREIFYISPERALTVVPVKTKGRFEADTPRKLFDLRLRVFMPEQPTPFAVAADGQRFLLMPTDYALSTPITVTVNWPALRTEK